MKTDMTTLRIPTPLRTFTGGNNQVDVHGDTVAEAMGDLIQQYPELEQHLFNGDEQLRPFVNLFINDDNVRDLDGIQTPISENDRLMLIPSIAGG